MRNIRASVLCLSLSSLAFAGCSGAQQAGPASSAASASAPVCRPGAFDAAAVERKTAAATVQITAGQNVGSGFVIDDAAGQVIVTNFHVLAGGTAPAAAFASCRSR